MPCLHSFGITARFGGPFFWETMQTAIDTTERSEAFGNDEQATELTEHELSSILEEIRLQPSWRHQADIEADYYDGNQLDAETLRDMELIGMAPIIENLIGPTVDAVLGLEAKTRLDFRLTPANSLANKDMAEAMNMKLNEMERESRADRACSDAYASQIKTGLGWVEVSREADPFRYPVKSRAVHRNEIYFDWRGKEPDLSDARFLLRKRWLDCDVLALAFPQHAELIRGAVGAWSDFGALYLETSGETNLNTAISRERGWGYNDMEWRDSVRKRACLYEVWYRRWVRGHVMKLPDGRVIEYNRQNPEHVRAVALGLVDPRPAIFSKMRLAWFLGPHCLADVPTPYKHNDFPYVPFWGKREDLTGVPYGLIRAMKPMQDEVNARNSKMVWLLAAKRVIATKGMVKDKETARLEIARPDAWIDLEEDVPNGRFEVSSDFALNEQQYRTLVDKREAIKNVGGVYNAMMGKDGQATSGIAIQSLVEQGTTTLAEINDNYRYARAKVGELLLSLLVEEMGEQTIEVQVDSAGRETVVVLNKPREDGMRDNDIQRARLKVALSDVPSTPSYRMQRLTMLTEITKSLPPNLQALVVDFVMASTDLPERDQIVERLRKALNLQVDSDEQGQTPGMVPEQKVQEIVQQAVQQAIEQAGMNLKDRELRVKEMDAETRRLAVESANENKVLDAVLKHGG